jgi:flagellar hook-associated protein 1 FlgK
MGLLPLLDIARSGLLAHEFSLSVIGNNIANVHTPGYTRQRAILAEMQGLGPQGFPVGRGVRIAGVEQVLDGFLERRRWSAAGEASGSAARRDALAGLAALFDEIANPALVPAVNGFFDAAEGLQQNPAGLAERNQLLAAAGTVASELNRRAAALAVEQRSLDDRVTGLVHDANAALDRLAELNGQIATAEAGGAGAANALRDERGRVLADLAAIAPVATSDAADGSLTVRIGGSVVVDGANVVTRFATRSGATGLDGQPLHAAGLAVGGTLAAITGGELGAVLGVRDGDLAQAATNLDTFANAFASSVNAVQTDASALDLDGNATAGTPLFSGTTAATIAVAITDPRRIAAARSSAPGDNRNALVLAALRDVRVGALGATFVGWLGGEQARIAGAASDADAQARSAGLFASELETQRDAISGVSLEEELARLVEVQHAFQASAKLVSVADEILDDLLKMV